MIEDFSLVDIAQEAAAKGRSHKRVTWEIFCVCVCVCGVCVRVCVHVCARVLCNENTEKKKENARVLQLGVVADDEGARGPVLQHRERRLCGGAELAP